MKSIAENIQVDLLNCMNIMITMMMMIMIMMMMMMTAMMMMMMMVSTVLLQGSSFPQSSSEGNCAGKGIQARTRVASAAAEIADSSASRVDLHSR